MRGRGRILAAAGASLVLASVSGFMAAQVIGASSQGTPRTVTINVATGETGPQGPVGPPGPAGTNTCPTGFDPGEVVINHPGGQTIIWTCLKNP
jgi:hypothetical protein